MEAMQKQIVDWRKKFGLPVSDNIRTLHPEAAQAHIELIREEFEEELVPALLEGDTVEIYDAGLDVIVYVIGLLSDAGYDLEPGLAEVMRGNYSKLDPQTGEAIYSRGQEIDGAPLGKVLKGSAYVAPNLAAVIASGQADLGAELWDEEVALHELSDEDLPGMWEKADFIGGAPSTYRDADGVVHEQVDFGGFEDR